MPDAQLDQNIDHLKFSKDEAILQDNDLFEGGTSDYAPLGESFSEILLSKDDSGRPIPSLWQIIEKLKDNRLIVVAGTTTDKRLLARHCAYELAEILTTLDKVEGGVRAIEGRGTMTDMDYLEKERQPAVFVLASVDAPWFHHNLPALRRVIDRHWVVLTTDQPHEAWRQGGDVGEHWLEPRDSDLYQPSDIKGYLLSRLPPDRLQTLIGTDDARLEEGADSLARRLGSPDAIDAFTRDIARADERGQTVDVETSVRNALDDRWVLKGWFQHTLESREKIAALALALLHGLDESLGFSVIDELMESAWRKRDTAIRFIDYGDLTNVRQYFSLDSAGRTGGTIYCKNDNARRAILDTAWNTHRRQILAALPVLVDTILATSDRGGPERQLFVSKIQNRQLRFVIGETLGEICLISTDAAEPHLLKLMASGNTGAHLTVARALRWVRRIRGASIPLELVNRWRSESALWGILGRLAGNRSTEETGVLVGCAVVTIMAELAMEDPIDHIPTPLEEMVIGYASTQNDKVFNRYSTVAIPALARQHTGQTIRLLDRLLQEIGRERQRNAIFAEGCGRGIGKAVNDGRPGIWPQVRDWVRTNLASQQGGYDKDLVSMREQKLAVALHTLSQTKSGLNLGNGPSPAEAMDLINAVLKEERHPFVREVAIRASSLLMRAEFTEVGEKLKDTIPALTRQERTTFIDHLVDLHCLQRNRQADGDTLIPVDGPLRSYLCPVWHSKDPDNTAVLSSLFAWSAAGSSSEMSNFASDALLQVRRVIERSQERTRSEILERRAKEAERHEAVAKSIAPALDRHKAELSFLERTVAVGIATMGRPELRIPVVGILGSMIRLPEDEAFEVIDRLKREAEGREASDPEGERLAAIARAARSALVISRRLGRLMAVACLAAAGLSYVAWNALKQ